MAQVKQLKEALDLSFSSYKRHYNALDRVIKSIPTTDINTRILKSKIDSLDDALNSLTTAHTSWVSKIDLSTTDLSAQTFSNQWLEDRWAEADAVLDEAKILLQSKEDQLAPPSLQHNQKVAVLEGQMRSLQLGIGNRIKTLVKSSTEAIPPASHPVLSSMVEEVRKQLSGEFRELSKQILDQSGEKCMDVADEFEKFHQAQEEQILEIQLNLAKSAPSTNIPAAPSVRPRTSVELEKAKVPEFSGNVIDYPEFKRGWQKVAGSHWDEENQLEQLKHKVDPHTKRILSRCNTMKEVWEALDLEYAQEQEVVNAVNSELIKLRSQDVTTAEYIVNLRNFLPCLEDSLRSVNNGLEHLHTSDKVNFLVDKFDERTLHEWEYYRSKNTGTTWTRFFDFVLDRYESSRSMIARLNSRTPCNGTINPAVHSGNVNSSNVVLSCFKCKNWVAKGDVHSCPACGHTASEGEAIGHCLEHCASYIAMSVDQRSDCVKNAKWCPVHLSSTHELDACKQKSDARYLCGVNGCTKHHHRSLHGSTTPFVASINSVQSVTPQSKTMSSLNSTTILSMQSISTKSGDANCFFDDGSDVCLILNAAAQRLGLEGEDVVMQLTTCTDVVHRFSQMYNIILMDNEGEEHTIQAFGIDRITRKIQNVDVDGVKEIFSIDIQEVWDSVRTRPSGEVDLLVGNNHLGLHPTELEAVGNIKVLKSKFGSGLVLSGSHPELKCLDPPSHPHMGATIHYNKLTFKSVRDYLDANELHVEVPRRCNNCMNCEECTFQNHLMSLREQYEHQMMKENVTYDEVEKVFKVKYVFLEDPSRLSENLHQAVKIAEREERKLLKEGLMDDFNAKLLEMISYGALIELSNNERSSWTGPVQNVSLQHVMKPESTTTPMRLVTNSSLPDRNGNSTNSFLVKGPNPLSDQRDVLSRWRSYECALSTDITKAYYSMHTGELERHVRRVVWRFGKTEEEWKHFGFNTVSFGDKPAGAYLDIVINETAERWKDIDPVASSKIMNDRYVDDIATGGSPSEVRRMAGELINSDSKTNFETNGTLSKILSNGNLFLKAVVTSGETNTDVVEKLGKYVLGVKWEPRSDLISIEMYTSVILEMLLNADDYEKIILTLRVILGIVNKPHDLLGLVSPITIRAMVGYRDLFRIEPALGWDDDIPLAEKKKWIEIFRIFREVSNIKFRRSTRPKSAVGHPEVVAYFDGSDNAYAAVIYLRWTLSDGSFVVSLACSKAKVTPLKRISTPRSELSGAVLLTRLVLFYLKSCAKAGVTPKIVWFLGDSECTLASIEKTSGALGEYFGNRVGEILDNQSRIQKFCQVGYDGEWWHVSSSDNAADQPTRLDSTAEDVGPNSPWQRGKDYLYEPVENWPKNRNFADRKDSCIPDAEILKKYRGVAHNVASVVVPDIGIHKLLDPFSTNDWEKLVSRTTVLLRPFLHRRGITDNSAIIDAAEKLWFQYAMSDTRSASAEGKLNSLCVEVKDGLVVVVGRAADGLHKLLGKDYLPVVMRSNRVAYLLMLWAHKVNHDYRDLTMSIACSKAWIVGAKRLATSICDGCVRCRFLHKLKVEQKMAALPPAVQLPCPPFSHIGLDFTGPHIVHAMTNKRATLKVWNVIFVCLNTKAVSMYLAPGYSTDDFFIAYNSHISDRGIPSLVHSDRGSQLVAAGKEIEFDFDCVAERSSSQGTNWDFTPAGAQWRNGAVEIFVKKFKKSFELLYAKTRLNYAEMSCAVKRIACVLNDRPLSVQKCVNPYPDPDFLSPITPNMLLTGRSNNRAPTQQVDINFDDLPQDRLSFVEELELAWWCQYKVQYFASLVPTQKWLNAKRNIAVGDIVLIEYKTKSFPGTYRLGRVTDVELDLKDNLVRTCTVVYKLVKPSSRNPRDFLKDITSKEVRLPVQRLVLILPVEEQ